MAKIKGLNAAEIMSKYVWDKNPHEKLTFKLRNNVVTVDQSQILKLLMDFQEWQLNEINNKVP